MKHRLLFILLLTISIFTSNSQTILWESILSRNNLTQAIKTEDGLFYVSDKSLFFISEDKLKKDLEITPLLLDRKIGLSDSNITKISYNTTTKTLVIYYQSGNIDLIKKNGIIENCPAIYENLRLTDKSISTILQNNKYCLLAGNFGISILDTEKAIIKSTYFIGQKITDISQKENLIFALVDGNQLFQGDINNNLQDPSNWLNLNLQYKKNNLINFEIKDSNIFFLTKNQELFITDIYKKKSGFSKKAENVRWINNGGEGIYVAFDNFIEVYESPTKKNIVFDNVWNIKSIYKTKNNEWWVCTSYGLFFCTKNINSQKKWIKINQNTPSDNNYFFSLFSNGRYFAVGGGKSTNRNWTKGSIKIFNQGRWLNITQKDVEKELKEPFADIVSIAVDPKDNQHFFASSWGEGLYEFRKDKLYKHYSLENSPLKTALPNNKYKNNFVRVSSLCFDKNGTLWMTQGNVDEYILSLNNEGVWKSYTASSLKNVNSFGDALFLNSSLLCIPIFHRGGDASNGILFINTNSQSKNIQNFFSSTFLDRNGKKIDIQKIYCATLDKNGALILGTDKGPILTHNYHNIIKENKLPFFSRPIGGVEPNLFYILDNIPVSSIVIDKKNNKWVGTKNDGIYLLSEDMTQILEHFTIENSPLLSNTINTIALSPITGQLFIGTSAGLITFNIGNSTTNKESINKIHIYPNPVSPQDTDKVTISGLSIGMIIKICNSSGELLLSKTANHSELSFNARTINGERFASGVYSAFIYDPYSKKSCCIRFAVI